MFPSRPSHGSSEAGTSKVVRKGTQKQHLAFLKDCWWPLLLSAWPWGPLRLLNLGFTSNQQGFHLWNANVILRDTLLLCLAVRGLLPSSLITGYREMLQTQNRVLLGIVKEEEPLALTLSSEVEAASKADFRCCGQACSGCHTQKQLHVPRFQNCGCLSERRRNEAFELWC